MEVTMGEYVNPKKKDEKVTWNPTFQDLENIWWSFILCAEKTQIGNKVTIS